jgi:diphthamide synthase (EF-2-diphthine--ammonia ligase)
LQASSLGVPLVAMRVPRSAPNAVYEERLADALAPLRTLGVRHVAFGDLFLADVKAYRDALMPRLGFEPVYPLWGADTRALARAFVGDGYRGITACVDGSTLGPEWAGRDMDDAFFAALPDGIDPCGEHGEFHSFVHDGPGFAYPVRFERDATQTRGGFHFAAVKPLSGEACARCGATFECGMKAGVAHCWCADVPPVAFDAPLAACLCPRCLRELAGAQT